MTTRLATHLEIPRGQRVVVFSDLRIGGKDSGSTRLANVLAEFDESVTVILTGETFANPENYESDWVHETQLRAVLRSSAQRDRSRVVVISDYPFDALSHDSISTTPEAILEVSTGSTTKSIHIVNGDELSPRGQLEDPAALSRYERSRVFYQRFKHLAWLPIWSWFIFLAGSLVIGLMDVLDPHGSTWIKGAPHFTSLGITSLTLLAIAVFESVLGALAAVLSRRNEERGAQGIDPGASLEVQHEPAAVRASALVAQGAIGLIVGGSPRPLITHVDGGFLASPGPSSTVLVERRGRLGLPNVFQPVDRLMFLSIQTGPAFTVRLVGSGRRQPSSTLLERGAAGEPLLPAPGETSSLLARYPQDAAWPPAGTLEESQRRVRRTRRWLSSLVFLTGLANLVSAIVPPSRHHLHTLLTYLPLGVAQGAAALAVFAGLGMVMVARGLHRGQKRARIIASVLYAFAALGHLGRVLHGGSLAEALINIVILSVLIARRGDFDGSTDQESLPSALPRLLAVAVSGTVVAALVAVLSDRHHRLSLATALRASAERLIGLSSIALPDRVDDFLSPTLLTLGVLLALSFLYLATRPVVDRRLSSQSTNPERRLAELRARDIVRRHGRGTLDYFALRDDKQFFFFHDSLVAYAVYGGVALISPDPIGPVSSRAEAFAAFRRFAEGRGWTLAIIGAGQEWLPIYQSAGLHHIYIGDEAVVNCQTFSLDGGKMKGLRQACTRLERKGYTVEFVDPATIDPARVEGIVELMGKLRRGEGERGFSMMLGRMFHAKDKGLLLTIVNDPNGIPAAICQFVPSTAISGYSLDLMRRDPEEHPNGLIDYALCSTITYLKEHGGQGLSLNFAAFRSVLDGEAGDGTFTKVERWALKRLSGVLPIESLWSFNAKYYPEWQPRYLVYPALESLVPIVAAVLRAESLTEIPVLGRFLANDPANRPGTVVPADIVAERALES